MKNKIWTLLALALVAFSGALQANPSDPTVIYGDVTFDNNTITGVLTVTSTSSLAIVEWDTFSLDDGEETTFVLPDSSSAILNRVTGSVSGPTVSDIVGKIDGNGSVLLVNENGITFDANAMVTDLNGFLASTLYISDDDFEAGGNMTCNDNTQQMISHSGVINITGGDAILIGYQVALTDSALMTTTTGVTAIGAGGQIVVQPTSADRIAINVLSPTTNSLTGVSIGLNTIITALQTELKADGNIYGTAISVTGTINASGITGQNGNVIILSDYTDTSGVSSSVIVNGPINNSNHENPSLNGGTVIVNGYNVDLQENCLIDCSGHTGGTVTVGDGSGFYNNAHTTTMEDAAYITVGASLHNAGNVTLMANGATDFQSTASIVATGGSSNGNGGTIELCGDPLTNSGTADVSAGAGGMDGSVTGCP